jgi:hypothetical protein
MKNCWKVRGFLVDSAARFVEDVVEEKWLELSSNSPLEPFH